MGRVLPSAGDLLDRFTVHLRLKRGMSANTVEAYGEDVRKLLNYCSSTGLTVDRITLTDLQQFAADCYDLGIAVRTLARIISGVKSFFRWLVREDYIDADHASDASSPKCCQSEKSTP